MNIEIQHLPGTDVSSADASLGLKHYAEYILAANGHPHYFGRERVEFPRPRRIVSANTLSEIECGYRSSTVAARQSLRRLTSTLLKHHLHATENQYWLFAQFVGDASDQLCLDYPLHFLHFDLDCHLQGQKVFNRQGRYWECHVDLEEYQQQTADFRALREEVDSTMRLLGIEPIYYRSPGNRYVVGGKEVHVYGVHGLILLDHPVALRRLQDYAHMFRHRHGLEIEFSCLTPRGNWRIPGQVHMDVVDLLTMHPLYQTGQKLDEFRGFVTELNNRVQNNQLTPVDILEAECQQWHKQSPPPGSETTSGCQKVASQQECLAEPNTFTATVKMAKLFSTAAIKLRGDVSKVDQVLPQLKQQFRAVRWTPETADCFPELFTGKYSATATNAGMLDATCRRILKWHVKNYKPEKDKEYQDELRFSPSAEIDLAVAFKLLHLSYSEKQILTAFWKRARTWKGRIAAKYIYMVRPICTKAEWFKLLNKLRGILVVLEAENIQKRHCRQWGFSDVFLRKVEARKDIQEWAQELLEEKKRERVYRGRTGKKYSLGMSVQPDEVMAALGASSEDEIGILEEAGAN